MTRAAVHRPLRDRIEDAKLLLDGARAINDRNPTTDNQNFVEECEARLDDLLDQYPR